MFFRPADATPLTVPYAGQRWQRLRVQGADACTQAVLRVISAPGEGAMNTITTINEERGVSYLPGTVTVTATSADHPLYQIAQSVEAPAGISLVRDSHEGTATGFQMDTAPALDSDPATGTTATGPRPGIVVLNDTERVIGLRLRYKFAPVEGAFGVVLVQHLGPLDMTGTVTTVQSAVSFGLPESVSTRDLICVAPPSAEVMAAGWVASQVQVYTLAPDGATAPAEFTVYDLSLLVVDDEAAQRVAESYLQPPYYQPTEVELSGLVPPRPLLTVTDSPDGTVMGETGAWEYQYTLDQYGVTLARLGSDGQDDEARAIKLAIRRGT